MLRTGTEDSPILTTDEMTDSVSPIIEEYEENRTTAEQDRDPNQVSIREQNVSENMEIKLILEQFARENEALRAQNRNLQDQLNAMMTKNISTVSTPSFPPISVSNPRQLNDTSSQKDNLMPGMSSTINVPPSARLTNISLPTSANVIDVVTLPNYTSSNSLNSQMPVTSNNFSLSSTNIPSQSIMPVTTNQPTTIPTVSISSSQFNTVTSCVNSNSPNNIFTTSSFGYSLPNSINHGNNEQTNNLYRNTSISPLNQWLQTNSYHSLVGQASGNTTNYHNQQLHLLPQFSGNPEQWPLFYSSFMETTRDFGYTNLQNTLRLDKSLTGRAREAVESLLINPNNVNHVMNTLEFMFGRPELLLDSQLEKIKSLTEVLENQVQEFIDFAIKIQNFAYYLETIRNSQHHLCNPTLINEIVNKIPLSKRIEWIRASLIIVPYPTIRHLANWLNNEAQLLSLVVSKRSYTEQSIINTINKNIEYVKENKNLGIEKPTVNFCKLCSQQHFLFNCPVFKEKSVDERWNLVKNQHVCFSCLKEGHSISKCTWKRTCGIRGCAKVHSRYLHSDKPKYDSNKEEAQSIIPETSQNSTFCNYNSGNGESKLFFKIIPIKIYGHNKVIEEFAFIDEGSNTSLIDLQLLSDLELKVNNSKPLEVKWFNGNTTYEISHKIDLCISSCQEPHTKYILNDIKTVKKLDLGIHTVELSSLPEKFHPIKHLPISYKNVKPRILIGLKHANLIFPKRTIEIDDLAAAECKLGWYLYGRLNSSEINIDPNIIMTINERESDLEIHELAKRYFQLDSVETDEDDTNEENIRSLKILENTTSKIVDKFETGLLWKHEDIKMPNNFCVAFKRLIQIEDKMKSDACFAEKYEQNLMEYVTKGYARKLSEEEINSENSRIWYLPHFSVFNPNKPNKFRIVFDAKSTFNGVSLNSCLLKGPDLNQTLLKVLLNFRVGKIGICGDIREMFPQIKIIKEDQHAQRFIWRHGKKDQPIDHYIMTSMTFGAACSPTSAQYVKNINAANHKDIYPEAAKAIIENHYVDDYVASFSTKEDAIKITKQVIDIHKHANFELRKFISNSEVLRNIGEININQNSIEKVLGLYWNLKLDVFTFKVPYNRFPKKVMTEEVLPTKRQLLQIVMSIFDPFGFLNNYTVLGRLILQDLWSINLEWDEQIPEIFKDRWRKWLKGLKLVEEIQIPRCFSKNVYSLDSVQVHIFTDASDKIFSAIAYIRIKSEKSIEVSMLMSKMRMSSRKKLVSIPRMELQGAVLGSRLQNIILENLNFIKKENVIFWCDSRVVLCWLKNMDIHSLKPYVHNRIKTINENTKIHQSGPTFLKLDEQYWPQETFETNIDKDILEESFGIERVSIIQDNMKCVIDISRYSSYRKLFRIMAWVIKAKNIFSVNHQSTLNGLSYEDLQESKTYLFKKVQNSAFNQEIDNLKKGIPLSKDSNIRQLCPFLDDLGVLRVRSRLEYANFLKHSQKYPIILPKNNYFTTLVIRQFHEDLFHQNKRLIINEIKMQFWVIDLKRQLEKVSSSCVFCNIRKASPNQPIMSPIPIERITPFMRPFSYTGLDYCGHFLIKNGRKIEKVWIILFTCMSSRAVHLEVVNNLKSSNCLLAISNFINRRGIPIQLRSDNAGYFIRSKKLLSEVISLQDIEANISKYNIKWVTNTPESPHMGGAWERLIRCVKRVLEVTINSQILTVEIFYSLVLEAENIVNSRPLTNIGLVDEIEEMLTPNHFLLGSASTFQTRGELVTSDKLPKQFRILQQIKHSLWVKWLKEYIPEITTRSKWTNHSKPIQLNDLVLICDMKQNYNKWTKGRVIKLYPGKDGNIRTVDVKTTKGTFRRPVNKLAVLNISSTTDGSENVENSC